MKKISLAIVLSICLALLYGCGNPAPVYGNGAGQFDIEIEEEQFAVTVIGIMEDFDSYVGKTVRVEGVFEYFGEEAVFRSVLRRLGTC